MVSVSGRLILCRLVLDCAEYVCVSLQDKLMLSAALHELYTVL